MPCSLSKRFNGMSEEIIEYTKNYGTYQAMERYSVKDYIAFRKFLEEKTGNRDFGINPTFVSKDAEVKARDLVAAFASYVSRSEVEVAKLRERVRYLEAQVEFAKNRQPAVDDLEIARVFQMCKA